MQTTIKHIVFVLLFLPLTLQAQVSDTLPRVNVIGIKKQLSATSVVPQQQLQKEDLQKLNSLSVADAVKHFTGAFVKDYGGIGGLKTVSVRSLGANHTGISYDGIIMSDAQGGQIDLGKLSLDNISSISLSNGSTGNIFMPARCFAYGSFLQLQSQTDDLAGKHSLTYKASFKGGSFGFINPAAKVAYRWSRKLYTALNAEWQRADGSYDFASYEDGGNKKERSNSDVTALRIEHDTRFAFNDSNRISLKAYYYNSERGLPGTVILNNTALSHERLWDKNIFVQASWSATPLRKSRLLVNAKYNYGYNRYLNPDFFNALGRLENIFHQKELYESVVYNYMPSSLLSLSYSSDYFITTLQRSDELAANFSEPKRNTWLNNLAARFATKALQLEGNVLSTTTKESVKHGTAGSNYNTINPAVALSWQPTQATPLRLRFFYKNIFRLPTFNDLYYTYVGNPNLIPEYAKQYNAGITWEQRSSGFAQLVTVTADAYYNSVTDKILAVPRQNLFQWSMQNIGRVSIKGLDAAVMILTRQVNKVKGTFRGAYTFQNAVDITNKTSALYNNQLPYTPKHSASASLHIDYHKFSFSYNMLFSGNRYKSGENNAYNLVEGYSVHDVSLTYKASFKTIEYRWTAEVNNIFNTTYNVIQYYPMPGINYRLGLIIYNK